MAAERGAEQGGPHLRGQRVPRLPQPLQPALDPGVAGVAGRPAGQGSGGGPQRVEAEAADRRLELAVHLAEPDQHGTGRPHRGGQGRPVERLAEHPPVGGVIVA